MLNGDIEKELNTNDYEIHTAKLIIKSKVIHHNLRTQSYNDALVTGRVGKSTGKNKTSLNIKHLRDDLHQCWLFTYWWVVKRWGGNFYYKTQWQNIDTLKAKNVVELEDWKIHNVYKEVEDKGEKFLSVRWVITPKYKDKNIEYKASLVARGFEIHEIHKDFHT